jgi:sulfite exporter TauE/SafE
MFDYSNLNSLPAVFIVGIIASISSCTSTLSSIILTLDKNIKTHIIFNVSRVVSFTTLGGLLGIVGSFFLINSTFNGYLILLIGVITLVFGLKSLNLFAFLDKYNLTLPNNILKIIGLESIKVNNKSKPLILGFLSFFIPCGFTQTVQLFSIASGSFFIGSLTMFIFSLGTIPGLIGVGSLVSKIKSELFTKAVSILIMVLAFTNIISGYQILSSNQEVKEVLSNSTEVNNGIQIIRMTQDSSGYTPNKINLKKGVPVRWIIDSSEQRSCAASLYSKELNISKLLKNGENIIEFTPSREGYINFSCSMGMYSGVFIVS